MTSLDKIAEVQALDARGSLIRIPGEQDVPVTPRIRELIDSQPFQRLKSISQLGLVSLVYPGATHTRFEHSLGVYRMSLLFLKRLATIDQFQNLVSPDQAELFIVAALLHDVGHWPYCHPFEDMGLSEIPDHELLARKRLLDSGIPEILKRHFSFGVEDVSNLLEGNASLPALQTLTSMLSGPVDVDKMDYLYRDSLHAGVPYGMHYDRSRLIGSLCLDEDGTALAITEKGCTAAELMVFARYVMFSEVYWHHTVRSATAMLQRAMFVLLGDLDLPMLFESGEHEFQQHLIEAADGTSAKSLIAGLFGRSRQLYKRLAQFTVLEHPELFKNVSRRPYAWLDRCSANLASRIAQVTGQDVKPDDILIDAPPEGLEVQFRINVRSRDGSYRLMEQVSPVVKTLAQEQFDYYVKRVRVFVNPRLALAPGKLDGETSLANLLRSAIESTGD